MWKLTLVVALMIAGGKRRYL